MKPVQPYLILASNDPNTACQASTLLNHSELDCTLISKSEDCRQMPLCRWIGDAPLNQPGRIQALLGETVETLERTRHAFKSPDLAQLRKRLQKAIRELSEPLD
ncbi:hypothetical protein [Pseudomonas sp. OTU5201]|uniref:hypothetical protein n=1 Tax=Pseudomonas sp. OTU5201 TaxID=3043850 RepID=UPI00313D13BA